MEGTNLITWLSDPALLAFLGGVYVLFIADFLTGVLAAIRRHEFDQKLTGDILIDQGTQIGMVTILALLAGNLQTPLGVMAAGAAAAYAVSAQKSIRDNLGELAQGPEPEGEDVP